VCVCVCLTDNEFLHYWYCVGNYASTY